MTFFDATDADADNVVDDVDVQVATRRVIQWLLQRVSSRKTTTNFSSRQLVPMTKDGSQAPTEHLVASGCSFKAGLIEEHGSSIKVTLQVINNPSIQVSKRSNTSIDLPLLTVILFYRVLRNWDYRPLERFNKLSS